MATRNYTKDWAVTASSGDNSLIRIQWVGLLNGDVGQPAPWSEWADRTLQVWAQNYITGVASVLGAGGSLSIEGSNDYDPVTNTVGTWTILTDQNGVAMTFTAIALKQGTEAPLWVRPHVTAGDGTTNGVVIMAARRIQPQITGG